MHKLLLSSLLWMGLSFATLIAEDAPSVFVVDFPLTANLATPTWLGQPSLASTTFARVDLPIIAPLAHEYLLVTVYFQEQNGSFLRLTWQGGAQSSVLSDNLYEGIGLANQGSVLITPETLANGGILQVQAGGQKLEISHVKFEWLESRSALVSPQTQDLPIIDENLKLHLGTELNGQADSTPPVQWKRHIVSVLLTEVPERIEEGVEYNFELESLPRIARIDLLENGLPPGQQLVVWINKMRAGIVTPQAPDLNDEGYFYKANGDLNYQGWRPASLLVPLKLLQMGANTLQFSAEESNAVASDSRPDPNALFAIKNTHLQLDYTEASELPHENLPTGPIVPVVTPMEPIKP